MSARARGVIAVFVGAGLGAGISRAAGDAGGTGGGGPLDVGVTQLVAAITAIGALGTAAFSLVDATKAFGGGVSNFGLGVLYRVAGRFSAALDHALAKDESGQPEWRSVVRAHWINGRPRDEQKAIVKSLVRLGLARTTAPAVARAGHVSEDALVQVATKLEQAAPLADADLTALGRLDASIDAQLDAAYDRADQIYRNVSRVFAAGFAIALGFLATWALGLNDFWKALMVGLLAVPLAPIAKDLASALQAAAAAQRAGK